LEVAEKKPKRTPRKRTPRAGQSGTVHELEITLLDVEPRVWRRFAVRSDISLAKLHDVIQIVMGWTDSHLHQFVTEVETRYAPRSPCGDPDWDERVSDSAKVRVEDILPAKGAQLLYQYDFGDGWEHVIEVVHIRPSERGIRYPRCMAGERACPPEDCGGPYSYTEFLAALADPKHPEHQELTEWIGGAFDAERFDVNGINEVLTGLR
jgi:hypothetical protein